MCQSTTLDTNSAYHVDKNLNDKSLDQECDSECNDESSLSLTRQTLDKGTLIACASLLLLITGMSITFPHMQSRRDELGCDALCYGSMMTVRSMLGFVGTAVIGRLSDRNGSILSRTLGSLGRRNISTSKGPSSNDSSPSGRRACLYLGTMATLVGLVIASSMNSLYGLWLSMIPGALLQHNFDMFKALLSEYHNDIENLETQIEDNNTGDKTNDQAAASSARSGSVGKLGMAAGISFMIGPMIAALVSPTFQYAAYFAIVCTLASGVAIYHLPLPVASTQKLKEDRSCGIDNKHETMSEFTLSNLVKLKTPKSRAAMTLLAIRLNMALAFHIFNTIWPASLKTRFDFGPTDHARFMSFIGISYAFSQGFLAKRLVRMWGEDGKAYLIMTCCAVLGAGRYIAFSTDSLLVVYVTFLFIINALGTVNTVITADTGSIAPSDEVGALFGILQAAENAAGMMGPFLGGVISHYLGKDAPLVAVVGVYSFLFAFVSWGYNKHVLSSNKDTEQECSTSGSKAVKKSV